MENTFFNFLYIAVIILGGVTLPLTIILYMKERDRYHRAMALFIGAIFVYMVVDFVTYYFLGERVSGKATFALITLSDILFYLVVPSWLYLVIVLIGAEQSIKPRFLIGLTVVYEVLSQFLSIWLGRYTSYSLSMETGIGKLLLQILDVAYVAVIIALCCWCGVIVIQKHSKGKGSIVNLLLILLLIGYMLWIALWDYTTWYKGEDRLIDIYAMDPLILFYAILSAFVIYYFYKKDPLKLNGLQIAPEDAVTIIARRYELSGREKEVLELLNRGNSNPQIAAELSIAENTVKRHLSNIYRKTGTQSRHEILFKISNVNQIDLDQ